MFGLTRDGFKRKRYIDIRNDLETRWKEAFGEDSNTTERSPNGILISLFAWALSLVWQLIERVYHNRHIQTAEGKSLDNVTGNMLVERRPATFAEGEVVFYGQEGAIIDDVLVEGNGMLYRTTEIAEIDATGEVVVPVRAEEAGTEGNTPANTVTTIVTPVFGVESVNNPNPISGGQDEETDEDLRERYYLSLAGKTSPTADGIRSAVLAVEGVRTANVIENNTNQTDSEGRPPKSFETYVLGGDPKEIAEAIFSVRAAGIEPWGTEEVVVTDNAGNNVLMRFSYVEEVPIYIDIEIEHDDTFHVDGYKHIRTAIIRYIGGEDEDGNVYTGLTAGQDMIFTKVVSAIHSVQGVTNIPVLNIGTDPNNKEPMNTIEIEPTQVAVTDWQKVNFL